MACIFERVDLDRDKFILSKGWAAASLYYFLHRKGRITQKQLDSYCQEGSEFIGLAEPIHPDIPFAGGSMGLALPAAVGFALAKKIKGEPGTIYVLMSEGEIQSGTTWEAAMIASHFKLDNLMVILDNNGHQAMGATKDIMDFNPVCNKFVDFGWETAQADGHNYILFARELRNNKGLPKFIDAKTVKGKGVPFMEDDNIWHYRAPNENEYLSAKTILCQR